MSELRRWLEDEAPHQVRRLLEVGQWERPSPAAMEQTIDRARASIMASVGNAPLPEGRGNVLLITAKWALIGALLLGAAAALSPGLRFSEPNGGHLPRLGRGLTSLTVLTHPASQGSEQHGAGKTTLAGPTPVTLLHPTGPARPQERSSATTANPKPSQQLPALLPRNSAIGRVCKPAVGQQIEILEQARSKIESERGAEALAILERYDRFGAGRCFVLESLKHRMDAYVQTGNQAEARRTANLIRTRYPDTAQAREAETVLKH